MLELDPTKLPQPAAHPNPTVLDFYNTAGYYSESGFPLFALGEQDYDHLGGLELQPYERGDSPSRDGSKCPYNATWFNHLRENYRGGLELLQDLRHALEADLGTEDLSGSDIRDLYHMGVNLPLYLLWRNDNPVPNGKLPDETIVLRQALLGIGTVLLALSDTEIETVNGTAIADIAESNGDLIGEDPIIQVSAMPQMVCPASPTMIANLGDALLNGSVRHGDGAQLDKLGVSVPNLRTFALGITVHTKAEEKALSSIDDLIDARPEVAEGLSLIRPKTKLTKLDEILAEQAATLDGIQREVYDALGREKQTPPRLNIRRYHKQRAHDLAMIRVNVARSDIDSNVTEAELWKFRTTTIM